MCFSAPASFAASAVLGVVGVATLRKIEHPREIVYASLPLLFGIQQFVEGLLWVYFDNETARTIFSFIFMGFSHVLWPILCPLSVYLIEPSKFRKKIMLLLILIGAIFSFYLSFFIYQVPSLTCIQGNHIDYTTGASNVFYLGIVYILASTTGFVISSSKIIRFYGVMLALSIAMTYLFYFQYFISVWCFFGAILASISYYYFTRTDLKLKQI